MTSSTKASRRQTLASIAVTAAAAMVPGAARAACTDLDELYDQQSLLDSLALNRRFKAAMRSWRLAMGYTQDEVAELLEMSTGEYSDIEEKPPEAGDYRRTGEVDNGVPIEVLAQFGEEFGIDLNTVFFDEITLQERPATRAFVEEALAKVPDDQNQADEYLRRLGAALRERSSARLSLPSALESSLAHGA